MRRIFILALAMGLGNCTVEAGPLHLAKRVTIGVAKEVSRTTKDLATWKYPLVNAMFLVQIGADLADAQTSVDAFHRGAYEQNSWLYGLHPSYHRIALTSIGISYAFAVADHFASEQTNRGPIRILAVTPQGIDALGHALAAFHNTTVAERRFTHFERCEHGEAHECEYE